MKFKIVTLILAAVLPAAASVTLDTQFGQAYDSSGNLVSDGTLWALVVDTNNNSTFTGFGLDSSLAQANVTTPGIADSFFSIGQTLQLGSVLNGNTVFAMGGFNGVDAGLDGLWADSIAGFNYPDFGTASGLSFAFYWFPGATYTGGASETIGSEVGGIHSSLTSGGFDTGMVLPSDGSTVFVGAATIGDAGGAIPTSSFTAVTLIPEPSVALLGAFGVLALLRRRR